MLLLLSLALLVVGCMLEYDPIAFVGQVRQGVHKEGVSEKAS